MQTDTRIHTRALLVSLGISTWQATKFDKVATSEVHTAHGASNDAGRYNKRLITGKDSSYEALLTLAREIRREHYASTLAWSDEGWRLLPTAEYQTYTAWYRQRQSALDNAVSAFVFDYPRLRDLARHRLNGLYRESDYPSVDAIAGKFSLKVEYTPIPATGDIRADLAADQVQSIEASIASRVERATAIAVQDAWTRLQSVIVALRDRMIETAAVPDGTRARFHSTLLGNVREVCDALTRLNVTNDSGLESMRSEVSRTLATLESDDLKTSQHARATTARAAQDILDKMSAFMPQGV